MAWAWAWLALACLCLPWASAWACLGLPWLALACLALECRVQRFSSLDRVQSKALRRKRFKQEGPWGLTLAPDRAAPSRSRRNRKTRTLKVCLTRRYVVYAGCHASPHSTCQCTRRWRQLGLEDVAPTDSFAHWRCVKQTALRLSLSTPLYGCPEPGIVGKSSCSDRQDPIPYNTKSRAAGKRQCAFASTQGWGAYRQL